MRHLSIWRKLSAGWGSRKLLVHTGLRTRAAQSVKIAAGQAGRRRTSPLGGYPGDDVELGMKVISYKKDDGSVGLFPAAPSW